MTASVRNAYGLEGKTCVVTGAGSGIGRGIAEALARDGARVAILDRNLAGAEETLSLVRSAGSDGVAVECDISDQASVEAACAKVGEALGAHDVLVNCAGIIIPGTLADLPLDTWRKVIDVNLTGYFLCSQVFGRALLAKGEGSIVHVSSFAAQYSSPFLGSYGVSKAGVSMLSRLLAVEFGSQGVRSNAVHPGLIETPMVSGAYDTPGMSEGVLATLPAHRFGQPEDIAHAVLSLASPRASYANGSELLIDGGWSHTLMSVPFATLGLALNKD